jgi:hypothetical protein
VLLIELDPRGPDLSYVTSLKEILMLLFVVIACLC